MMSSSRALKPAAAHLLQTDDCYRLMLGPRPRQDQVQTDRALKAAPAVQLQRKQGPHSLPGVAATIGLTGALRRLNGKSVAGTGVHQIQATARNVLQD